MALINWLFLALAMLCFAANSLLCRMALVSSDIDPASFTLVRLLSGAFTLFLIAQWRRAPSLSRGSLKGAFALFVYAAGFSFAYVNMTTGTGALILFGSVQLSMLSWGIAGGERFSLWQWLGFVLAVTGLVVLLLPGLSAPPLFAAGLMVLAGIGWGVYSVLGKGVSQPLSMTAGNFILTIPMAVVLYLALGAPFQLPYAGTAYAVASGAIASGIGYAIWYRVLPVLASSQAATVQLSVPVIAMGLGWLFLAETVTGQMLIAAIAILGGIGLVVYKKSNKI